MIPRFHRPKPVDRLVRAALAEPPRPQLPGATLEPGFRRRWLWFFLPASFLFMWLLMFIVGFNWQAVGVDARIYYRGSAAWLAGADPWTTHALLNGRPFTYAGLPPTTILLAPLTWLPEETYLWLWVGLSLAAAVAIVRSLRLPIVWIVYPPLMYAVVAANPHVVVMALVVAAGTWGGALASGLKIVAIPPLIGERRWRALLIAAVAFGATALAFPGLWSAFLDQAGTVQNTINAESGGSLSAWGTPVVFVPTFVSLCLLARIDFRAAAWLAVPALFPTTQYYYAMFALPIDPFLAAVMAMPLPLMPPLTTIGYTAARLASIWWRRHRLEGRPAAEERPAPGERPAPEGGASSAVDG
jgi:hypothetical protein